MLLLAHKTPIMYQFKSAKTVIIYVIKRASKVNLTKFKQTLNLI